jgi:hypothetical protein
MGEKISKQILINSEIIKRNKQYKVLEEWYKNKITAKECIEKIIQLEKLVFLQEDEV